MTGVRHLKAWRLGGVLLVGGAFVVVPVRTVHGQTKPASTTVPSTTPPRSTATTAAPADSSPAAPPSTTATIPSTTPAPPSPAGPNGERSSLDPEHTRAAEAELATLTGSQRALLRQLQAAKDELTTRRFALIGLAREAATVREQLEQARAAEDQARARVDETMEQIRRAEEEIDRLAAATYRSHSGPWSLDAINTLDVGRADHLSRARAYARSDFSLLDARVDSLTALRNRLEVERRKAESVRAEAEASAVDLEARLTAQTQGYQNASDTTARIHVSVVRSLGADASLVAQLVDPKFGVDDITAVLGFVQSGQPTPLTTDGIFALPIAGARLNSHYGLRIDPIGGSVGFHSGVDFEADARTPIRSAAAGMVVIAGDCGGYGTCAVIDHGASLATVYGHQSQLLTHAGDFVDAGEIIGLVGSTGYSTGPHLHLEVRLRGAPIDPVPTLTG